MAVNRQKSVGSQKERRYLVQWSAGPSVEPGNDHAQAGNSQYEVWKSSTGMEAR